MLQKTDAVVLHAIKYGEQRMIVDMFTRVFGRLSFIVSLPKSARSATKKQYFQPLTLLSVETDMRPLQQLQKLRDVSLLQPLGSLQTDAAKLAVAMFVAEFLYHALRGEQQDEKLFDYVRSSIEWLDGSGSGYANFHLVFLMRMTRFLGFYPNTEGSGPYFDLQGATFCDAPPLHRNFLMPEEARHIALMMRMDYATMHLFRFSRQQRQRVLDILIDYYRLHLPTFPELKSIAVLRELFD